MATLNYFLDDVKEYIKTLGYSNIFVDFIDESLEHSISLVSLPGDLAGMQYHSKVQFEVHVINKQRKQARIDANNIFKRMQNKEGHLVEQPQPVYFLGIQSVNSGPYLYKTTKNGGSDFLMLFESNIRRPDLTGSTKNT